VVLTSLAQWTGNPKIASSNPARSQFFAMLFLTTVVLMAYVNAYFLQPLF